MKVRKAKKGAAGDRLLWDITVDLLHNGNVVRFQAPGVSMSPFIRHHEIITIRPCSDRDIRFGDIILYSGFGKGARKSSHPRNERKIAHRFLGTREVDGELRLITKGDNNYLCDPPVLPHQVLGKVVKIDKSGWRLSLDSPFGRLLNTLFGLAIISPVSYFIYPCMKKVKWVFHRIINERKSLRDHVQ
jgi:signal peptidase I